MKVVAFWVTLIRYAKELAEAERSGDTTKIKVARRNHDNYKVICLKSDEIVIPSLTKRF